MTEPIFSKHVFPKFDVEELVKPRMQGLSDPTMSDFQLLDISALYKDDCKEEAFEQEFVKSFLSAAKVLAAKGRADVAKPHVYVFYEHSYAIPVLYLTRHCMELALKRGLRRFGIGDKQGHDLDKLWSSLLSKLPSDRGREEERAIKNMGLFVRTISDIDHTGFDLRYPTSRDGSLTQDRSLWVNGEAVVNLLERFVEQLEFLVGPGSEACS